LGGFAEMCFLDPDHFDGRNDKLQYSGEEKLRGRLCWVYRVSPKVHSKGWRFEGIIWVLPGDLTIIRFEGAFRSLRRIDWPIPVEEYWFHFNSWRKEINPGVWVPDFTCTGMDVGKSNFIEPAFRARIRYSNEVGGTLIASSDNACGMEIVNLPGESNRGER